MPPAPSAPSAPAAPAAPSPAPAPAPSPAPAAPPAAPAPSSAPSGGDDPIRAFDKQLTEAFDKAAPLTKKPDAPAKPGEPTKPAEPAKPAEPKQVAQVKVPKELRAELDRVTGELGAKSKQITEMEAKIRDYEAKGKDTSVLTERLGTLEKQLEEIRAENRALRHETSPEFKKNHEVPFQRAADRARRLVESLDVTDPKTSQTRKGTLDDMVELHQLYMKSPNKAIAVAEELLGEHGTRLIVPHLEKLYDMQQEADQALAEEKANWKQKLEEEESTRITQQEELGKVYEQVKKELAETVDDYHDDPTDKELVSAREEAYKLFDAKPATVQQRIIKNAHIRHRFAAFGALKLKTLRQSKEIADLKAELETYKNEPPDPSRRKGGKESGAGSDLTWEQQARKELM